MTQTHGDYLDALTLSVLQRSHGIVPIHLPGMESVLTLNQLKYSDFPFSFLLEKTQMFKAPNQMTFKVPFPAKIL